MKDIQATEEAYIPQKRRSSTSKFYISSHFFAALDPDRADKNRCGSMPIRIQNNALFPSTILPCVDMNEIRVF
jgi:hypothetical protein